MHIDIQGEIPKHLVIHGEIQKYLAQINLITPSAALVCCVAWLNKSRADLFPKNGKNFNINTFK
jgi:hypothetical protein